MTSRGDRIFLVAAGAAGSVLLLWQLGASSFFVDETVSAQIARAPADSLFHLVQRLETSPPTYFVLLHAWASLVGSTREWALRVPSAAAVLLLLGVMWRLGRLFAGGRAARMAVVLGLASPLLLQYAQQARVYAALMLVTALAVLGAIEAERRGSARWLAAATALEVIALWLHYFGLLIVAPLVYWMLRTRSFSRRVRVTSAAVVLGGWALSLPLTISQYTNKARAGLGADGNLSAVHAVSVIGGPFDGRYAQSPHILQAIGAVLVAGAAVIVCRRGGHGAVHNRGLLITLASFPALALIVLTAGGEDVLVSRYVTPGAPFMLLAIAVAITLTRRQAAAAIAVVTLAIGVVGVVLSQRREGRYPDTRGVVNAVAGRWHAGDGLVSATSFADNYVIGFYASGRIPNTRLGQVPYSFTPAIAAHDTRVWVVVEGSRRDLVAHVPPGYEVTPMRTFNGLIPLTLGLAQRPR